MTHPQNQTQASHSPREVDLDDPDFREPDTFAAGSTYQDPSFHVNSFGQPVSTTDPGAAHRNSPNAAVVLDQNGRLSNIPNQAGVLQSRDPANQALRAMITPNGESRFGFTGSGRPVVNEQFFKVIDDGKAFQIKDGVSPSAAIQDLLNSPSGSYGFECATAISVNAHLKAYGQYQQQYGAEADTRFDQDFAGMKMGYWGHSTPRLQLADQPVQLEGKPKVGEGYYFQNNFADYRGVKEGWSGENAIYAGKAQADGPVDPATGEPKYRLGEDLYFGHPFGIASEKHIISSLLGSASGINPQAEGALTAAANQASGRYANEMQGLLTDFRAANSARQENIGKLEALDQAYSASPNEQLAAAWKELLGKDNCLDQGEQHLSGRARTLLTQVDEDLRVMGGSGLARSTTEYQRLLQMKQALEQVMPGEHMVQGYRQAPYW